MERVLSVENHHPVELRDFACVQFLACGSRPTIELGALVGSERMAKTFLRSPATLRWLITIHFQIITEPIMYHQVSPEKDGKPAKT